MISDLYSNAILDAAASIPLTNALENPHASATKVSRVCGSEIRVDIQMTDDVVTAFAMDAKACALGQAAASLFAQNVVGATAMEIIQLRNEMRAMLKENGNPPAAERWKSLSILEAIRDYPQRHASTMLVFEATVDCLEQLGYAAK